MSSGITHVVLIIMLKSKLIHMIFLPLEKTLTFHNVEILIKSVFNKDQNHHYNNVLLEKYLYHLGKK